MTQAPKQSSPWLKLTSLPEPLKNPRFVLEPLAEKHAELDFEALMSCRGRLGEELQWGDWPLAEFTVRNNRDDLRDHHDEFVRHEAFAYTVLSPDRSRCLGCIYIERCADIDGAQLAFWVIDDAIEIETRLVTEVVEWVHKAWGVRQILIPLREANTRELRLRETSRLRRGIQGRTAHFPTTVVSCRNRRTAERAARVESP